jgi:hypothetical protein
MANSPSTSRKSDEDLPIVSNDDDATTRPTQASHRAARRNGDVQRYTVDLAREQRRALALCAADWEVDKSRIIRTLIYLLEADNSLRERVQEELFNETVE